MAVKATDGLDAELNADAGIITDEAAPAEAAYTYEIYVNYIDPDWNGESTGYYAYTGGDFSEEIRTAQTNPEGLVFSGWTADSDELIIEGADSAQAVMKFDPSVVPAENKVINVTAIYAEPQKTVSELMIIDGSADTDIDLTQVEEGTLVTVSAAQKSGLVFTGWTADGIEMSEEERSQAAVTITMPANAVTLTAQYRMETEAQPETPAEVPAETPVEVQTEAPAEVLTAQNASIESDDAVVNEDGSVSVTVDQGDTVTVVANDAPDGQEFAMWNVTSEGDVETSDVTNEILEVKVSENVTVEPVFAEEEDKRRKNRKPAAGEPGNEGQQPESQGTEKASAAGEPGNGAPAAGEPGNESPADGRSGRRSSADAVGISV